MADPYADGTYRWWHLTRPSPELVAAKANGWLGKPGRVLDAGCGLGTETAYLARRGWHAVGTDLSRAALLRARREHPGPAFVLADVRTLPFKPGSFDLLLDRGCFHYLPRGGRSRYAAEAERVLRPGGRLLLRACRSSAGVPNDIDEHGLRGCFGG